MSTILSIFDQYGSMSISDKIALSFSEQSWGLIFSILFTAFVIERIFQIVVRKLSHLSGKTQTDIDDKLIAHLAKPIGNYIYIISFLIIIHIVNFYGKVAPVKLLLIRFTKILIILNTVYISLKATETVGHHLFVKVLKTHSKLDDYLISILVKTLKAFFIVLGFVYVIQELGYSVSSIIAGLGIGGLAVAMASKDALANFFGSLVILLDRPFKVGDIVSMSGTEGVVEDIGFRSTKIRTYEKTLVAIPNSELSNSLIDNKSKRPIRRVRMTIGLTYDTTISKMEKVLYDLKSMLSKEEGVVNDNFYVKFTDFGASSLDILIQYFTESTDYVEHLSVRESVNIKIMKIVEENNLEFAFPSQSVYIKKYGMEN